MKTSRTSIALAALAAAALWAGPAWATPTLYANNCTACHSATVTTCNGCHAHGTHPDSTKSSINVTGVLSKTSFAPGETVSVTVTGGYRTGWLRALLFDQNGTELARSSCPGGMGGCTTSVYPVTLTAPAPATPGTYTWAVAWYGNQFDMSGASFGQGTSTTIQPGFFTPDPNNPEHGFQTVALTPFTVAAPAQPSIALSPASLTFPTVTLGGSARQTAQVQNTGTAPLSVTAISLCAGTSPDFTWSPAAPLTVAAGGSASLTVTFTPTAAGTESGCLALASNDPANPTVDLQVSGTAVAPTAPAIALAPASLDFGAVQVGMNRTLTTQIQSTGTAELDVTAIAACAGTSAEFSWTPAGPLTLAPGQSATLSVTYAPTDTNADTGCLALTTNASATPTQLALSGSGQAAPAPAIALSPTSLDFGAVILGATGTLPVQVQNGGSAALNVTAITTCAGTSGAFTWSPAAPFSVQPGQATTVNVTYAPLVVGADTGCLTFASNDPANPSVNLTVSGMGVAQAAPAIALVPPALDFGTVTVGSTATRTTQLQDAGTAALHVSAIAACTGTSTAFSWSPAAPLTVAAGGSTALTVTFAPTAAGNDDGCLVVTSDDPANPTAQLALTATAAEQPTAGADIDLHELDVPRRVGTSRGVSIHVEAEARNEGTADGTAAVTLVGVLNGTEVYRQTVQVTAKVGGEAEFAFPPYAVASGTTGTIAWTASVDDPDGDVDQLTASTQLVLGSGGEDDGGSASSGGGSTPPSGGSGGDLAAAAVTPKAAGGCSGGAGGVLSLALMALSALALRRRGRAG